MKWPFSTNEFAANVPYVYSLNFGRLNTCITEHFNHWKQASFCVENLVGKYWFKLAGYKAPIPESLRTPFLQALVITG